MDSSSSWQVGSIKITQIIETEAGAVIQSILPDASRDEIQKISWLTPNYADGLGNLKAVVQCFLVEIGETKILIDTCIGNDKSFEVLPEFSNLQFAFLDKLNDLNAPPEKINYVLCTHLHFDHIGWNTIIENGKWVPTFKNAKYLFSKDEYDYWKDLPETELADDHKGIIESVKPIIEADLHKLIEPGEEICAGVKTIPSPGHTPGHVCVLLSSDDNRALITGDFIHHPCQVAKPRWKNISDNNNELAIKTRELLLEEYCGSDVLIIGSHFSVPSAGYVLKDNDTYLFSSNTS